MNRTPRRFVSPFGVVTLHEDGKPSGSVNGNQVWSLPFMLVYSTPHPKTMRNVTRTYRVYHDISEPAAPFILVRGDRLYLTPSLARKVTES